MVGITLNVMRRPRCFWVFKGRNMCCDIENVTILHCPRGFPSLNILSPKQDTFAANSLKRPKWLCWGNTISFCFCAPQMHTKYSLSLLYAWVICALS